MEKAEVKAKIREIAADRIASLKEMKEINAKEAWSIAQEFVVLVEKNKAEFGETSGEMLSDCMAEVLNEEIDIDNMPAWLEENYFKMAIKSVVEGYNKNFGKKWASKITETVGEKGESFFKKAEELAGMAKNKLFETGGHIKDKATEWKDGTSKYVDDKIAEAIKEKLDKAINERLDGLLDEKIKKIIVDKMNAAG